MRARLETTGVHVVVMPGELTTAIGAIGDPEGVAELGPGGHGAASTAWCRSRGPTSSPPASSTTRARPCSTSPGAGSAAATPSAWSPGRARSSRASRRSRSRARSQAAGASMLRGGAFKPRTSPFAFKGLGDEALEILAEARAETGLPVVTELLDAQHAEAIARARRRRADRRAQHAELRAARGRRQDGQARPAQARAELLARRAAAGRRLHPQGGQRGRRPLRARDPHLRDRDALHARPRRGAVAEAPHPPAGHRRPLARRGRPAPGRAALARRRRGGRRRHHRRGPPGPRRGAVRRPAGAVDRRTSPTTRATSRRTRRCWASGWPRSPRASAGREQRPRAGERDDPRGRRPNAPPLSRTARTDER